jgi:hypothetical protein
MSKTLGQLIDELTEVMRDNENGSELPVRIAYQPNYPLRATVECVALNEDDDSDGQTVWIAASSTVGHDENPYAPASAWESY